MRNHRIRLMGMLVAIALSGGAASAIAQTNNARDYDPRDFTGIWNTNHAATGGYRSISAEADMPKRTPWGEAVFSTRITGRDSKASPIGLPPVFGNDPMMDCNPEGFPGVAFGTLRPVEFFNAPNRLIMFFEWQRTFREIWLDGRELPKDPEPRWSAHSVGRWEGDTFVVDSVGFDSRAWLDYYGNVFSDEMRLQERWQRVDKDTLTVTYRLEDPKAYVAPWQGPAKTYKRQPPNIELREEVCAPMDELYFTQTVRDRAAVAGGVTTSGSSQNINPEMLLDKFADALTLLRRIRSEGGEEWQRATNEAERTAIEDRTIAAITKGVSATIPLNEYQRIARLINVDPDTRAAVFARLAERDESLRRLNVSLEE